MWWRFELTSEEFDKCEEFANDSSKTQREHRSGGTFQRTISQIKEDTLRGKVGEVIIKNFLSQEPFNLDIVLDFGVYPRGKWDSFDIKIGDKTFSIKSAKWFSNWLLLESQDLERGDTYDYYILVLIDEDFKSGIVKGFADKDEILSENDQTLLLKKGEIIPNTNTPLDADNHARHINNLKNTEEAWKNLIQKT